MASDKKVVREMTLRHTLVYAFLALTIFAAGIDTQGRSQNKHSGATAKADLPIIDINKAGVEDFDRLQGIGPVLARGIVDYRAKHGAFRRVEDLLAVPRIGYKRWKALRPYLKVADVERMDASQSRKVKAESKE